MTMTGRNVLAVVLGVLAVLLGVALIAGASAVLSEERDADGFYMAEPYMFETPTRAIVSEDIAFLSDAPSWLSDWVADPVDLRIRGISSTGESVFMGIGATADVQQYLNGAPFHEVTAIDFDGATIVSVDYQAHGTTAVPGAPGDQQIWEGWTESEGPQSLEWSLESGNWTVVVMNSDASPGVGSILTLGARLSNIAAIAWVTIAIGMVFAVGGGFLVYRGLRRPSELEESVDLREPTPAVPTDKELAERS
jgi:hypothetical protein